MLRILETLSPGLANGLYFYSVPGTIDWMTASYDPHEARISWHTPLSQLSHAWVVREMSDFKNPVTQIISSSHPSCLLLAEYLPGLGPSLASPVPSGAGEEMDF